MEREIRRAIMSNLSVLNHNHEGKGITIQSLWHYATGFCRDYGKPSRERVKKAAQAYVAAGVVEVVDNKYYRLI